jgi:hypothetical protein
MYVFGMSVPAAQQAKQDRMKMKQASAAYYKFNQGLNAGNNATVTTLNDATAKC